MTIRAVDEDAQPSSAEVAAERFARALGPAGLTEFPLTALDRVGLPVWSVWWQDGSSHAGGIGYGMSEAQARVGALGEALESAASSRFFGPSREADVVRGSFAELVRDRGADGVVDPRTLGLPAGSDYSDERPLSWLPTTRRVDGSTVLVPAEFAASSPEDFRAVSPTEPLIVPVTNGQGAGSTLAQAVRHAVLELLQRDGNGLAFRALDRGTVVDLDDVRDATTVSALARLRDAGVEVLVKLAATDLGLPNLYVVGAGDGDDVLQASACGEAVGPDREVALRKAVLEFASARARKRFMFGDLAAVAAVAPPGYLDLVLPGLDPATEEERVLAAMMRWRDLPESDWRPLLSDRVLARRDTVAFSALPTGAGDPLALLLSKGFDVLVADLSSGLGDGVHAVKVLVPGLEVETVAYGRIGERNVARLLADGRTDLVHVGERPDGWARVHLTPAAEKRLGGPAFLNRRALTDLTTNLLPLYREPSRHTVALALEDESHDRD